MKNKTKKPYSIPDLWLNFGMSIEKTNILWILIINLG